MSAGIDSQLGVAAETTYGTFATPNRFLEFDSESLAKNPDYLTSSGIRRGQLGNPVGRDRQTTRRPGGGISLKVPNKGFGLLLNLLHGSTVTPEQQASTEAYKQVHPIGLTKPTAKSLTVQVNKPGVEDGDHPFSYVGCMISQIAFNCELAGDLSASIDLIARDELTDQALATPSYAAGITSRDFTEGYAKINGDDVTALIQSIGMTIPISMKDDRFGFGRGALRARPVVNGKILPTITLSSEFTNDDLYGLWDADEAVEFEWGFLGPEDGIDTGQRESIVFHSDAAKIKGSTPAVGGPDVLTNDVPLEVFSDGTNPLVSIETISTDTAL